MTRLFLIRHGETESNVEKRYQGQGNSPLTPKGISQAKELAQRLAGEAFSAVYSSDLSRAYETAKMLAAPHNVEVAALPALRERYYGDWENLTFEEIAARWPELYAKWLVEPNKAHIPQAEKLSELQKRAVAAIENIVSRHNGDNVAVIGHGGINRAILFHYLKMDLNDFWRIKQDNVAVNVIEFRSTPSIRLLNGTWPIKRPEHPY